MGRGGGELGGAGFDLGGGLGRLGSGVAAGVLGANHGRELGLQGREALEGLAGAGLSGEASDPRRRLFWDGALVAVAARSEERGEGEEGGEGDARAHGAQHIAG